jgi:hypothetical protein
MIIKLALRSLAIRPVRTAVLACGFGLGIAVMAELLGIGEVILDQARSPALQGGGDLVVSGMFGAIDNARFILSSVLGASEATPRIAARSPSRRATLYLIKPGMVLPVVVRGGVPSLEKAVGDREVASQPAWADKDADSSWANPDPSDVLRSMDRFHPRPDAPEFGLSWAEWLYFNGRTPDGRVRFYLTFLSRPSREQGVSSLAVRLQLSRDGRVENFSSAAAVDDHTLLENAPDLEIGGSRVHLEGLRYLIRLRLRGEGRSTSDVTGELSLDAVPGRSLPPAVIHGVRGWLSGYVVPVLSGRVHGMLKVGNLEVPLEGASGYHDHNWGFWQDVRWQWGQVAYNELSLVYGRVFPPSTVADPDRIPGFLGVLGPEGLIGVSTDVSITEDGTAADAPEATAAERIVPGAIMAGKTPTDVPREIVIEARGARLQATLRLSIDGAVRTPFALTRGAGSPMDFLQLSGTYRVTGRAGGRSLDFVARGAAETFRPGEPPVGADDNP